MSQTEQALFEDDQVRVTHLQVQTPTGITATAAIGAFDVENSTESGCLRLPFAVLTLMIGCSAIPFGIGIPIAIAALIWIALIIGEMMNPKKGAKIVKIQVGMAWTPIYKSKDHAKVQAVAEALAKVVGTR